MCLIITACGPPIISAVPYLHPLYGATSKPPLTTSPSATAYTCAPCVHPFSSLAKSIAGWFCRTGVLKPWSSDTPCIFPSLTLVFLSGQINSPLNFDNSGSTPPFELDELLFPRLPPFESGLNSSFIPISVRRSVKNSEYQFALGFFSVLQIPPRVSSSSSSDVPIGDFLLKQYLSYFFKSPLILKVSSRLFVSLLFSLSTISPHSLSLLTTSSVSVSAIPISIPV